MNLIPAHPKGSAGVSPEVAGFSFTDIDRLLTEVAVVTTRDRVDSLFANPAGLTDEEAVMYDASGMTPEVFANLTHFCGGAIAIANVVGAVFRAHQERNNAE